MLASCRVPRGNAARLTPCMYVPDSSRQVILGRARSVSSFLRAACHVWSRRLQGTHRESLIAQCHNSVTAGSQSHIHQSQNRVADRLAIAGSQPASPPACGASPCTAHPLNTNQGSFVRCHSNGTVPASSHSPPERLERGNDSRRAQSSRSLHKSWPDSVDYSLEEDGDLLEGGSSGRRITPP